MGLEVGIVGLPNVGKSTLFQAITATQAEAANYPFCTIDKNIGVVEVPDERINRLVEIVKPHRVVPNILKMVDIAGLVKGASKGEGKGNDFLQHIRETDAIAHVVRCFDDDQVIHVDGRIDPESDIEVIKTELILADLKPVEKRLETIQKQSKGNKDLVVQIPFFKKLVDHLNEGKMASAMEMDEDQLLWIRDLNLITTKPYFYVMNVAEDELDIETPHQEVVKRIAEEEGVQAVKICGRFEAELASMEPDERAEFMEELGLSISGLGLVIQEGFRLLNQITYFTAGVQEVRAWNIQKGTLAPQAAGKIHSDFERGFIRAEVFHFEEMDKFGSEAAIKEAGKFRTEGKTYEVKDGDIMHFLFNV